MALRVLLFGAAFSLVTSSVSADPIAITSGALTWVGGPLSITLRSAEFTFDGNASIFGGLFRAREQCGFPPYCTPGGRVDLTAGFSDLDLPGTATLDGQTWRTGSLIATAAVTARWMGQLEIPADYAGGPLTAPFGFTGLFSFFNEETLQGGLLPLVGSGTATATFVRSSVPDDLAPGALSLSSIRYDFESAIAPTPEPASFVLLGSGLAGIVAMRRRRKGR